MRAARAAVQHDILGREPELAALRSELSVAMKGRGRLALVTGEPGIGKTTLLTAHAGEARARGALVAWGYCHEMAGAPVYWPWLRMLQELVDSAELSDEAVEALGSARQSLRDVSSEARLAGPEAAPHLGTGHGRFELFGGVARALALAARKRGLVLAIDDLHWADVASVRLLAFLASELASDPVLILATLRAHEPGSEPIFAELARHARGVPLGPLPRSAVEALLAERVPDLTEPAGAEPEGSARPDPDLLAEEVWRRSDGNPFFALELAQLLQSVANGAAPQTVDALPFAVERVIRGRLARLPVATLEVLRAASVIGREFDPTLLARMLDWSETGVRESLAPAHERGLVTKPAGDGPGFAFAHALTREAIYEGLDESAAACLHGRVAVALEAGVGSVPVGEHSLTHLAHHFHRASAVLGHERAADYAFRAGMHMLDVAAYEEAAIQIERALALMPDDGATRRRAEARIALGRSRLALGEREEAERVLADAVDAARALDDPALFGEAVLAHCSAREEIGLTDFEGNQQVEAALAMVPDCDSPLRARLVARFSYGLHLLEGSEARRREISEQALAMARRLGDVPTLSYVSVRALFGLDGPDHLEERVRAIDAMLAACAGDTRAELNAWSGRADACAETGDRAGLDHAIDAFEEKASQVRLPFARWQGASLHAALALLEGRFEDAEERIVEALRLGERTQAQTPGLHFAQQMFMLRGWQGRMAEVAPLLEGSAEAARIVPAWRCALANLYAHLGRDVEARREFDAVAHDDFGSLPRDTTWLTSMVLLSAVCARLGDLDAAKDLYAQLAPFSGRVAVASPVIVMICPVDLRLGQLAGLLGLDTDAEVHFDRAQAQAESMRALPWQAEVHFRRAEWLLRRAHSGDAERAARSLERAEAIASAVGMVLLLDWIEELRSANPRASAAAATATAGRLEREGETWVLEFGGCTTRLRAMVGLAHLHRLLASPDSEIHVLELSQPAPGAGLGEPSVKGDAGPLLDAQARASYLERARDLRANLERAEAEHDEARRERLASELEFLTRELERAFGLGGRERRAGAAAERARVSVTRAIKYATKKIEQHDPALADHIARSVRTGTFCVYAPSDRDRVDWRL